MAENDGTNTAQQAQDAAKATEDQAKAVSGAADAHKAYDNILRAVKGSLGDMRDAAVRASNGFKDGQFVTEKQVEIFSKLGTAVVGAGKSFDSLKGIDASKLSTFSQQWTELQANIQNSPALGKFAKNLFSDILSSSGVATDKIDEAKKKGTGALVSLGQAFFQSADQSLKLQEAMIQISARSGDLDNVYKAAGPNLEHLNSLTNDHYDMLKNTAQANYTTTAAVTEYYTALGKIPGVMSSTVQGADASTGKINMLSAAMKFAKGSGMELSEVQDNLRLALNNYNIKGEDALRFMGRMTELSGRFGVELSDVQTHLRSTSETFKMFGDNAESAAKMVNSYLGELQKTGISGKVALEVITGMTEGMKGMSLAQKSFLSAQTGGPGGLMGGIQIEKMMRDGKIDEVFDKVRQSMSKQFGSIVTMDEASQSQSAAAQFTKQRMLLQQGPLGQFAKDDQSAARILEAFKSRDSGGSMTELSKSIVQDNMKNGQMRQEQTASPISMLTSLFESGQAKVSIANLNSVQSTFTARTGSRLNSRTGDYNNTLRGMIRNSATMGDRQATASHTNIGNWKSGGKVKDRTGEQYKNFVGELDSTIDALGETIQAPINKMKNLLANNDTKGAKEQEQIIRDTIKAKREENKNLPALVKGQMDSELNSQENSLNQAIVNASIKKATATPNLDMSMNLNELGISSTGVNTAAARSAASAASGRVQGTTPVPGDGSQEVTFSPLTINLEHTCPSCGDKSKDSSQSYQVNTAQKVRK